MGEVLRREADEEQWTLFSLSGFRGDHPLLVKFGEDQFRLGKRRYYHNDFARYFYARFKPEQGGTRIEGRFDLRPSIKWFMRIWLSGAVLIAGPMFLMTLSDMTLGSHYMTGDTWVGLIQFPIFLLFGLGLPQIGRLLTLGDEKFILRFVQDKLAARLEESPNQ